MKEDNPPYSKEMPTSVRATLEQIHFEISGLKFVEISKGNFIETLAAGKEKEDSLRNSFIRNWNKNRFFRIVETRCRICFPHSVTEKKWNFDDFVDYVESRQGKPTANLTLAKDRLKQNSQIEFNPLIVIAIIIAMLGKLLSLPIYIAVVLFCLAVCPLFVLRHRDMQHFKHIISVLEANAS